MKNIDDNDDNGPDLNSITIKMTKSMMRVRSHMYPDYLDYYVDTTYYDDENKQYDLGYQRLRKLELTRYPQFQYVKKLIIHHNNLKQLPDPSFLPYLEELTCSHNELTSIPFYPNLTYLNISNNMIKQCDAYHYSNLYYFDCSNNDNFRLNICLPKCIHLYISDNNLSELNLQLLPSLRYLDCGQNRLTKLDDSDTLVELDVQHNHLKKLGRWPKLQVLMADYNDIKLLSSYSNLIYASISHNQLFEIRNQPHIQKLIANNNKIRSIGSLPEAILLDLSGNQLSEINLCDKLQTVSLHFNPMNSLNLDPVLLNHIKKIQVNYPTYQYMYPKYYDHIKGIQMQTHSDILKHYLETSGSTDSLLYDYLLRKYNKISFRDREIELFRLAMNIFWYWSKPTWAKTVKDLVQSEEFKHVWKNIKRLYYKTLIVTIYLNETNFV